MGYEGTAGVPNRCPGSLAARDDERTGDRRSDTVKPVEAVIFDYGGVFSSPLFAGLEAFEATMGYPDGSLGTLLFGEGSYIRGGGGDPCDGAVSPDAELHDFHLLERGEMTLDDYVAGLVARAPEILGEPLNFDAYQRFMIESEFSVHWPVVHRARGLRDDGLALGMLTNNVAEFSDTWRASLPVDELFPVVVDSSRVGMRKPEPGIYVLTCEQVGVDPDATVFIDDNADNCAAADALGIEAIRFEQPTQMIDDLDALLARRGISPSR